MFTTGFAMDAGESALPEQQVVDWLHGWASKSNALVGGSVALKTTEGAVNRFLLVEPNGRVHAYDKRHLFRMAGEHLHYQAGKKREIFEWRGWRILPQICYDLRFPVWSRYQQDYDLALYVANWPAPRSKHWQTLLAARAIENQVYVAGCNRVGEDGNGLNYSGDSLILSPQGETLAQAEPGAAARLDAELSLENLQSYRSAFPAWRDADSFLRHD
jgi:predicted amidohydrolase